MAIATAGGTGNEGTIFPFSRPIEELSAQGLPGSEEVEITVLGISENSGESIVIHVGNGEWVVVDSCKTRTGLVLPLFYLNEIGADLSKVLVVACTHLHSDHIEGLNEVLCQCKQARFAYSLIGDKNTMKYIIAQCKKDVILPDGGVFGEFMKCIDVCKKEHRYPIQIGIDQAIYAGRQGRIFGVSPSVKMNEIYQEWLLRYSLSDQLPNQMLKTNFCSVASIIEIGEVRAILGADLEANRANGANHCDCIATCKKKNKRGWCNVFDCSQIFPLYKYDYIKIPHHSSVTGYCPKLWNQYMEADTVGTSTIFMQGKVALPEEYMISLYSNHCKELYYTSDVRISGRDKKGKSKLEEVKNKAISEMVVVQEKIGIVTSRKLMNGNGKWITNFFNSAVRVK